jgi:hypothetical protein
VPTVEQVRAVLRTAWHRLADECAPLPGGITATNWSVGIAGLPYTVKIVPSTRRARVPLTEPAEGLPS